MCQFSRYSGYSQPTAFPPKLQMIFASLYNHPQTNSWILLGIAVNLKINLRIINILHYLISPTHEPILFIQNFKISQQYSVVVFVRCLSLHFQIFDACILLKMVHHQRHCLLLIYKNVTNSENINIIFSHLRTHINSKNI